MTVNRITKQLKKEIVANKGKAAALGVMSLVAIYFWAPLVGKWFVSDHKSPATAATFPSPAAGIEPTLPQTVAVTHDDEQPWQEVFDWISSEPLMASASVRPGQFEPFGHLQPATPEIEDEEDEDEAVADMPRSSGDLSPTDLGMVLNSTLVGRLRSIAQIDGSIYAIHNGNSLQNQPPPAKQVVHRSEKGEYRFTLVAVQPGRVLLQAGGKVYTLSVKGQQVSNR